MSEGDFPDETPLDDDAYLVARFDDDGNLWIEPCGIDGILLRPEQQVRLWLLLSARSPGGTETP